MKDYDIPILLITFNRPDKVRELIKAIEVVKPKRIYFASDGPREGNEEDLKKVMETRSLTNLITWECEVKEKFSKTNLNCGSGPKSAIDWLFEHEEMGIILEDDCCPNSDFFQYCEEVLRKYKDDDRIMHVAGQNQSNGWIADKDYSYYFSGYPLTWGWATWKRAWEKYHFDIENYPELQSKGYLRHSSVNYLDYLYWKSKFDFTYQSGPDRDSWDYQWHFAVQSNSGLCVTPTKNLVVNTGFGEDAHHTMNVNDQLSKLKLENMSFPLRHPDFMMRDFRSDRRYIFRFVKQKIRKRMGLL